MFLDKINLEIILKKFLTSKTGANICYISTQDVSFSKDPNKRKKFVTDNSSNTEGLEQWEMALNDDEFLINFLAFSIVDDLLFLSDTLRNNVDNYGCLKIHNINTSSIKFKIKIIDHLPDCPNIKIEMEKTENFFNFNLMKKLQINSENRKSFGEEPSSCLTIIKKQKQILEKLESLEKFSIEKLLMKEKNKNIPGDFSHLVKLAKKEIDDLIEKFPTCFVVKCSEVLDLYYNTFINNFDRLTTYYEKWYKKGEEKDENCGVLSEQQKNE